MDASKALAAFSALANADRLALIRLLIPYGTRGLSAGEIARALGLSASRLSFHLSQLEQADLIGSQRVARHVIYQAKAASLEAIVGFLMENCCCKAEGNAACEPPCPSHECEEERR